MSAILNVRYLDQSLAAPTGCEIVTVVMLLNYLGIDITIDGFIDGYLPTEPFRTDGREVSGAVFDGYSISGYTADGKRITGANPNKCFAGNPRDVDSMGCYAPVLLDALGRILTGSDYLPVDATGAETDELIERYIIGEKIPVAVWTTIDLKSSIEGPAWFLETGEKFVWRSNEHCMLLLGREGGSYVFADPWNNNGIVHYPVRLVNERRREQYMMAAAVVRK